MRSPGPAHIALVLSAFWQHTITTLGGSPVTVVSVKDVPNQMDLNFRLGKLMLDERAEIYLLGRNLLGFVRDRNNLATGGFANWPVGATVLVGISIHERRKQEAGGLSAQLAQRASARYAASRRTPEARSQF